jgi:SAM-dependent methyltransferase
VLANNPGRNDMGLVCPVCEKGASVFFADIDGFEYLQCDACRSLHIANDVLADIDRGNGTRLYDEAYWNEELRSARARAKGDSLARAGEAILYCQRPVTRFLDVGTGPGYLLDELAKQFPERCDLIHGVELFPPKERSDHPNYVEGDVGMLDSTFDAGVCIEVVEHLTPRMLGNLAEGLARVSRPNSLWLFNTGMPDYVINEDPGYLDPLHRGHIVSYSLQGAGHIFGPHGFKVRALPGKSFAFVAEFQPGEDAPDFGHRIYHSLPENEALLKDSGLIYQAAFESARAYFYYAEFMARTSWALSLQRQLGLPKRLGPGLRQRLHAVWKGMRRSRTS